MAESVIEYVNPNTGDVREMIVDKVVTAHNLAVEAVIEYKEQGDVDELADDILANTEPVRPTPEQMQASKREENPVPLSLEHYKFLAGHLKAQYDAAVENLKNGAMEAAKAGISADYDIDKGRAAIKELRADWSKNYQAGFDMLKMVGSIVEETETDENGKSVSEWVAKDHFGTVLLKAASVPSVRAKRDGSASVSGPSEGAKIRAWGKENGYPDLNDRGPLPTELKEAYAAHIAGSPADSAEAPAAE